MAQTESSSEYNGWTNYETWCVNLWLNNEESTYNYWREAAGEAREASKVEDRFGLTRSPAGLLADRLRDELQELAYDQVKQGTLCADLLNGAMSSVDWQEVADAFLEE